MALCLFLAATPVSAQKLVAQKTTIDVGKTGYQQPVTAVFEFQNKSIRRLRISEIRPDCNCTAVDYPRGDIGMGEKFQVRMTYDARQLGHFDKQAAIISNGTKRPVYITMKGVVLADVQDFSDTYPIEMGDLLLNRQELEFDDVNRGALQTQELLIYNNGTHTYEPNLMHLPSYLTAVVTPQRLAPGRSGKISVTLHSSSVHDYGLTQSTVYLAGNPGDKVRQDYGIDVSVVVLPPFDGLTEAQRQMSPHIMLTKETVDISFDGKKKKSDVIIVTNSGHSELSISSLQLFTGGLKVSLGKRTLSPGESTKLKITAMRDALRRVRTRPRILMITNDPDKQKVTININAK